jgi:hypothetical protein
VIVPLLVLAATAAMSAVLLWAGLDKARSITAFASVLRQLGVAEAAARSIAFIIIALEISIAIGLIYYPSLLTLASLVILAATFAFAGLSALWQNKRIICGCFGASTSRPLGQDQLVAFPLWLGGAAVLWFYGSAPPGSPSSLLVVVALMIATVRAVAAVRSAHGARGDRRSAQEMYVWLNR